MDLANERKRNIENGKYVTKNYEREIYTQSTNYIKLKIRNNFAWCIYEIETKKESVILPDGYGQ